MPRVCGRPVVFWRADELEALEEERAMAKAAARRRKAEKEYDELVRVLLVEGGLRSNRRF